MFKVRSSIIICLLVLAQLLLMLVSWIWSAAVPSSGVRSMLSSEGIRWFLGHFSEMLATPLLIWILLLAAAYGCVTASGLFSVHSSPSTVQRSYRAQRARVMTGLFIIVYLGIILLMTAVPHAVLLSADGSLWPSPFSSSGTRKRKRSSTCLRTASTRSRRSPPP